MNRRQRLLQSTCQELRHRRCSIFFGPTPDKRPERGKLFQTEQSPAHRELTTFRQQCVLRAPS
jgi:hypothetical protein